MPTGTNPAHLFGIYLGKLQIPLTNWHKESNMKKLLVLVALVLALSFTALAQATGAAGGTEATTSTTTTKKTTKKKSAKEHTLTGCLAKAPSGTGYVLTNGRYKKGVDVSTSEDWSAHEGHTVRLTGVWVKKGEFKATSLKHISDTCTMGKKSAKHTKAGKTATTPKS